MIIDLQAAIRNEQSEYSKLLAHRDGGEDILIDSTGLPNCIHFQVCQAQLRKKDGICSVDILSADTPAVIADNAESSQTSLRGVFKAISRNRSFYLKQ